MQIVWWCCIVFIFYTLLFYLCYISRSPASSLSLGMISMDVYYSNSAVSFSASPLRNYVILLKQHRSVICVNRFHHIRRYGSAPVCVLNVRQSRCNIWGDAWPIKCINSFPMGAICCYGLLNSLSVRIVPLCSSLCLSWLLIFDIDFILNFCSCHSYVIQ